MIQERFTDYLFELCEGKMPEILKPQVEKVEGNVIYLSGSAGIKTAVYLHGVPYDSNLPCLGMALFGMFWPTILKDVDKIVHKRWKILNKILPLQISNI